MTRTHVPVTLGYLHPWTDSPAELMGMGREWRK